jgi:hypothetical protein
LRVTAIAACASSPATSWSGEITTNNYPHAGADVREASSFRMVERQNGTSSPRQKNVRAFAGRDVYDTNADRMCLI